MNTDYWLKMKKEIEETLSLNGRESDIDIDDNGILTVHFEDEWTQSNVSLIQTREDDYIDDDLDCVCDCTYTYDIWEYLFLHKENALIHDVLDDIDREIERAIDYAAEEWYENHDSRGNEEPDPDMAYEAWKDSMYDR